MKMLSRHSILCGASVVAMWAATSAASAGTGVQPADAAMSTKDDKVVEEVIVTGSNLRRTKAEGALPVTVIEQSDIELRGGSTGADLFATLPFAGPPAINEATIASQGARGDVASIDLRGIGAGSTLMLINGRRIAPHPLSGTDQGVPVAFRQRQCHSRPPCSRASRCCATAPPQSMAPTPRRA
jgi:iron complex outermembrane receptor protein